MKVSVDFSQDVYGLFSRTRTQCAYQDYMDGVHNYVMKTFATEAISGQGNMTMLAGKMNGLVNTCKVCFISLYLHIQF